jgi:hypothetical protein
LRAYRAGQLREEIELAISRAFWAGLRQWMSALAEIARVGLRETSLPHRLYFTDLTHSVPEAPQALGTPFWEQALPFARCPEIVVVNEDVVHDVVDATRQTHDAPYLLVRALARQVAVLFAGASVLDRSLAEIVRWRQSSASLLRSR